MADQRRDQPGIVIEREVRLEGVEVSEEALLLLLGLGGGKNLLKGFGEIAGQTLLGDVAGGPFLEGLDGDVLAAVSGHENDGQGGIFAANGLHELQAVHLRHEHVGQDDIGHFLLEQSQRLDAVASEEGMPASHFLDDGPGEMPVHGRVVHHENGVTGGRGEAGRFRLRGSGWVHGRLQHTRYDPPGLLFPARIRYCPERLR